MKTLSTVSLRDVQAAYAGPEGRLWELVMGEQIHIGGLASSMDLAEKAGITPGMRGVDLCCCNGAGMRVLVRLRNVAHMIGVDATASVVDSGRRRCQAEGLADKIEFVLADATASTLPSEQGDFVWGEDAWCYVVDKTKLIWEAARMVRPGGIIAFTDWTEGKNLSNAEARRYMAFMKFPSILTLEEYACLLHQAGCTVQTCQDTGRFAPYAALYVDMLQRQLTYDALKIIGFDTGLMETLGGELRFIRDLAAEGKILQGLLVATKH